ncbi:MAG: hypothetical protein H8E38_00565 [SAR324 cluster bacterium]|nr:hypothetical protein [SAR324 cluster bacterium]MBL7035667.1 hypothetical protein [SAR324 cluster bacterium]
MKQNFVVPVKIYVYGKKGSQFLTFILFVFLLALLLMSVGGCEKKNEQQLPAKLVWDRDICVECSMAVSDRRFAAQVVDDKGKPYFFDDIGCAVNWLKNKNWKEKALLWIQDVETEEWIKANEANWTFGNPNTPMGYGFSASKMNVKNSLSFEIVEQMILNNKTLRQQHQKSHKKEK